MGEPGFGCGCLGYVAVHGVNERWCLGGPEVDQPMIRFGVSVTFRRLRQWAVVWSREGRTIGKEWRLPSEVGKARDEHGGPVGCNRS